MPAAMMLVAAIALVAIVDGFKLGSSKPVISRLVLRGGNNDSGIGWDSHQAIAEIPDSLVKTIEGNESMRRKFELLCRNAQASIC